MTPYDAGFQAALALIAVALLLGLVLSSLRDAERDRRGHSVEVHVELHLDGSRSRTTHQVTLLADPDDESDGWLAVPLSQQQRRRPQTITVETPTRSTAIVPAPRQPVIRKPPDEYVALPRR